MRNKKNITYVTNYKNNEIKSFNTLEESKEDYSINKSEIKLITINDKGGNYRWCIVIYSPIDNINLMED